MIDPIIGMLKFFRTTLFLFSEEKKCHDLQVMKEIISDSQRKLVCPTRNFAVLLKTMTEMTPLRDGNTAKRRHFVLWTRRMSFGVHIRK